MALNSQIEKPDFYFSYVVDNEKVNTMPKKNDGYYFSTKSSCNNGVKIGFDSDVWQAILDFSTFQMEENERTTCRLVFEKEYQEEILHESVPLIKEELIPITLSASGEVRKADLFLKWYSYEEQKWANAVILKDKNIHYQNNEIIKEENIEAYFVWIPKYRYQLWDLGNYNYRYEKSSYNFHHIW